VIARKLNNKLLDFLLDEKPIKYFPIKKDNQNKCIDGHSHFYTIEKLSSKNQDKNENRS
jgi:hypothetical protein